MKCAKTTFPASSAVHAPQTGIGTQVLMVAALMLAAIWILALPAAAASPVGSVDSQVGSATVTRGGSNTPLAPGQPVFADDRIATGQGSRVKIVFADRSTLVIGSNSQVHLADYELDAKDNRRSATLTVLLGIVRAVIMPSKFVDQFDIRTRTTVASARSTEWTVEMKTDRTSVFVVEGRVSVLALTGAAPVTLEPAFGTDVVRGNPPTAPVRWGAPRVADTLARTADP